MNDKELYEALDTVWAALPTDAAQQEFTELVSQLAIAAVTHRPDHVVRRWLLADQRSWPAHLRDDAPSQRCDRCGRSTWSTEQFDQECGLTLFGGPSCPGRFRA